VGDVARIEYGMTRKEIARELWRAGMDFDEALGRVFVDTFNYGPDDTWQMALSRSVREELNALAADDMARVTHRFTTQLMDEGYDSIVYWNTTETGAGFGQGTGNWSAIIFEPTQVHVKPIWEMTREEFNLFQFPGIGTTARNVAGEAFPKLGQVNIGEQFWWDSLTPMARRGVLIHEAGHSLETAVMSNTRLRGVWNNIRTQAPNYIIDTRGKMEELAESYSLLFESPATAAEFKKTLPDAYKFVVTISEAFDFPLPTYVKSLLKRSWRTWINTHKPTRYVCGTPQTVIQDSDGVFIENLDTYIEKTSRGIRLVIYVVDEKQLEEVE